MLIKFNKTSNPKRQIICIKSDSNKYIMYNGVLYKELIETPLNKNKITESDIEINEGEIL